MMRRVLFLWLAAVMGAIVFIIPPAEGLGNVVKIAFFHIPLAWVSVLGFLLSAYWGIQYLRTGEMYYDLKSSTAAKLGLFFCIFATLSGMVFAKLTWGAYWNWDPRQITIFILLLIYGSYITLRSAIPNIITRARTSAVYGLFAFFTVPFLMFIIPRFYFSLHPEPIINRLGRLDMDSIMAYGLLLTLVTSTALFRQILCYLLKKEYRKYPANMADRIGKDGMKL